MGDGFLDDVGDSHKMDMANGPAAPPLLRASTSSKTPEEFGSIARQSCRRASADAKDGRARKQTSTLRAKRRSGATSGQQR